MARRRLAGLARAGANRSGELAMAVSKRIGIPARALRQIRFAHHAGHLRRLNIQEAQQRVK